MLILSVESTCDETAVAVTENDERCSPTRSSRRPTCTPYTAASCRRSPRAAMWEVISRLADRAIAAAGVKKSELDAVAVSYAPGPSARCSWA